VLRQPIIAGVDDSPESLRAAALAYRIAHAVDARCVLVHAVPDVSVPRAMAPLMDGADLRQSLAEKLGAADSKATPWELVIRSGPPGVVLDQVARELDAELIIVGGRHHAALARGTSVSTAHHLVRTSSAPVLVVGTEGNLPRRILVATDLAAAANPVFSTAWRYAELLSAELRVLHVIEPATFATVAPLSLDQHAFEVWSRRELQRLAQLELPRVPPANRVVRRGYADEEIAEEAAGWRADLVVIGSHGRGWVDRLLIGSTTERLLNRLPASLLVVPVSGAPASACRPSRRRSDQTQAVTN
jgi:nucleotide-binding universal stress UspA family protein